MERVEGRKLNVGVRNGEGERRRGGMMRRLGGIIYIIFCLMEWNK